MKKEFSHFADLYRCLAKTSPKEVFLADRVTEAWHIHSKKEFLESIRYLTLAFSENNWSGKQLAIALSPSANWLMLDYALMLSGAVCVPLFTNISSKNLRYQLSDADIQTVFAESETQAQLIQQTDPNIEVIFCRPQGVQGNRSMHDLLEQGEIIDHTQTRRFDDLLSRVRKEDVATIVYTSGTSGNPKGVELTHANLISQIHATAENYFFEKHSDVAFSFLPLAHIFERMVMHFYVTRELTIYFADDVKNVAPLLKEVNPTVMTVVPRLLEKVYFKMKTKALEGNFLKRALVMLAFWRATKKDPTTPLTLLDKLLDRLVYTKLRQAFGTNIRMLISGGAALSDPLYRFYLNIGVSLYQGYGLTESSPVIASNTPHHNKVGTCGQAFPGVEVKVSEKGELLAKGPNIMRGYHRNPQVTAEAIDEAGFLHTGDLAEIDSEGFIRITGRKKELLKTSTGEYISSVFIEQALMSNGWFEYVLLIGEGKPYAAALLFVEHEFLGCLAVKMHSTPLKVLQSKKFREMTEKYMAQVNRKLNHWEKVRAYKVISDELTIEKGFLTPSMKLAKKVLMAHYSAEIDTLYKDHL